MKEVIDKFLLARDTFMPEMHLEQPGFTYSACGPFSKKKRKKSNIYADKKYRLYLQK